MSEEYDRFERKKQKPVRRTKYEIWVELLEACLWTPRTQSWLMRKLSLKTSKIKETLSFLLSRELLESTNEEYIIYRTTEKGSETLKQFYDLILNYFQLKK